MITAFRSSQLSENATKAPHAWASRRGLRWVQALTAGLFVLLQAGCETMPSATATPAAAAGAPSEEALTLKPGDVLKISFPGVPTMDTTQPVRADGKISLPMAGDITATGQTTEALNEQLKQIYATKLVSNEVSVSLVSSSYTIYVTGAVLRPGKVVVERRLTVFEAIMEAGGFDKSKANLRSVSVVRQEGGKSQTFTVNVQKILSGDSSESFYLKPADTVYVPEKFRWF